MAHRFPGTRLKSRSLVCAITLGVLIGLLLAVPATADIFLSVNSDGSSNVDLGGAGAGKSIDFYISEDAGSNDDLGAIFAQFTLGGGVVTNPAGTISSTGSGTTGYFGAGNLDVSTIEMGANSSKFEINQFFKNDAANQQLMNDSQRERWFTLNLDTTAMAEGSYSITLDSLDESFRNAGGSFISAIDNNLTFTVSAVPEPSSLAVVGFLAVSAMLRRRRSFN